MSEAVRWILRLLLAAAAATMTWVTVLNAVDRVTTKIPSVQTDALLALNAAFEQAAAKPRHPLTVGFFGDSLSMPENFANISQSTPERLRIRLGEALAAAKLGNERSIHFIRIWYSGLSQWSLYYMAPKIAALVPDVMVVEFNLFNFGTAWQQHDRTILSSFLALRRWPETLTLPLASAEFATDQWIFNRTLFLRGWLRLWSTVQREQARCAEAYWILNDQAGRLLRAPQFTLRELHRLLDLRRKTILAKEPSGNRATEFYARRLFGKALTGVDENADALGMLEASLDEFKARGVSILVYVPPYNLEHLRQLGLREGSRLDQAVGVVRQVAEAHGARFLDLHAMFGESGDSYFRDNMDHLSEAPGANGHDLVAQRLTEAIADEARRIVAARR